MSISASGKKPLKKKKMLFSYYVFVKVNKRGERKRET